MVFSPLFSLQILYLNIDQFEVGKFMYKIWHTNTHDRVRNGRISWALLNSFVWLIFSVFGFVFVTFYLLFNCFSLFIIGDFFVFYVCCFFDGLISLVCFVCYSFVVNSIYLNSFFFSLSIIVCGVWWFASMKLYYIFLYLSYVLLYL